MVNGKKECSLQRNRTVKLLWERKQSLEAGGRGEHTHPSQLGRKIDRNKNI